MNSTIVEPRGCGMPRPGKCYLELKLSKHGIPFQHFIIDPVLPVLDDLGVSDRGMTIIEMADKRYISDHVGSKFYPNPTDFIEEVWRLGFHQLIERSFPFGSMTPDMWYLASHDRAFVADPEMRLKYYRRAGRDGSGAGEKRCPNPLDEVNDLHMLDGETAAASDWCAGLNWETLTVWDAELESDHVFREMPSFQYYGKRAIEGTESSAGFILAFPLSAMTFKVYEDKADGEHEKTLAALENLPEEMKGQVALASIE